MLDLRECANCGDSFSGPRTKRYCSRACQLEARNDSGRNRTKVDLPEELANRVRADASANERSFAAQVRWIVKEHYRR